MYPNSFEAIYRKSKSEIERNIILENSITTHAYTLEYQVLQYLKDGVELDPKIQIDTIHIEVHKGNKIGEVQLKEIICADRLWGKLLDQICEKLLTIGYKYECEKDLEFVAHIKKPHT